MNGPGAGDDQVEHHANSGRLNHQAEGLIIVDAGPLGEAAKDLASLVPFQSAIRVELTFEDSCSGDDVGANEAQDKIPAVVGDQGNKFFFHGAMPIWINEGGANGGGHR
jgi:hypothetical protein